MNSGARSIQVFVRQAGYFFASTLIFVLVFGGGALWWIGDLIQGQAEQSLRAETVRDVYRVYNKLGKKWLEFEAELNRKTPMPGWKQFTAKALPKKNVGNATYRKFEVALDEFRFVIRNSTHEVRATQYIVDFWSFLKGEGDSAAEFTLLLDPVTARSAKIRSTSFLNKQNRFEPGLMSVIQREITQMVGEGTMKFRSIKGPDGKIYWLTSTTLQPQFSSSRIIFVKAVSKSRFYSRFFFEGMGLALLGLLAVSLSMGIFYLGTRRWVDEQSALKEIMLLMSNGGNPQIPNFDLPEYRDFAILLRRISRRLTGSSEEIIPVKSVMGTVRGGETDHFVPNSLPPRSREPVAMPSQTGIFDLPEASPHFIATKISTESPTLSFENNEVSASSHDRHTHLEILSEGTNSKANFMDTAVSAANPKAEVVSAWDLGAAPARMQSASRELQSAMDFLKESEDISSEAKLAKLCVEHFQNLGVQSARETRACWVCYDDSKSQWVIYQTGQFGSEKLPASWASELDSLMSNQVVIQKYGDRFQNFFSRFLAAVGFDFNEFEQAKVRIFLVAPEGSGRPTFFAFQHLPSVIVSDSLWATYEKILKAAWINCHSNRGKNLAFENDHLTGLLNRQSFREYLVKILGSLDEKRGFSLVLFDLDQFQAINKNYGAVAGDQVLRLFAEKLGIYFAPADAHLCRTGPDEFAVLLMDFDVSVSQTWAEFFRRQIEASTFNVPSKGSLPKPVQLTVSASVVGCPLHGKTADELIRVAEQTLQVAKREGRNTVQVADDPTKLTSAA